MKRNLILLLISAWSAAAKKPAVPEPSPIDVYIQEASARTAANATRSNGAIWSRELYFGDLAADLRARRIDDIVSIVVNERASAISRGSVSSSRQSDVKASVTAAVGPRTTGWLPNLAAASSNTKLDGQGQTARETELRTSLTARVVHVLPNGNLVVEGSKMVTVNSETQRVMVRGVVRPIDLTTNNAVSSDQLAMLEVSVAGRGIVGDAIRRPNVLYRVLLGLLPF